MNRKILNFPLQHWTWNCRCHLYNRWTDCDATVDAM